MHLRPLRARLLGALLVLQQATGASDLELDPRVWPAAPSGASSCPSWLVAAGPPELLVTRSAHESARLELNGPGAQSSRTLASGTGWFLNWADFPAAARLSDGTVLAAWLELLPGEAHSYGTRFALLDPHGARRGDVRPLEEHRGPGEHGFVSLAPLDDGRFLALWLDGRAAGEHGAGETRVYARTIGADGTLAAEQLVDPRACSCCPTALVRLADGSHLAAWRDRSDEELRDIALARFDGTRWTEPEALHADGWKIDGCPVNGPRLAANRERVAATWFTGADGSVRASLADVHGHRFGAPIRIDDGAPEGRGDAAFLPDGSLLVGWMEHEPKLSSWRVRRVLRDGSLGPSLVVARVSSERSSGFLRMSSDEAGVLVAYTETDPARAVVVRRVSLVPPR